MFKKFNILHTYISTVMINTKLDFQKCGCRASIRVPQHVSYIVWRGGGASAAAGSEVT